MKNLRKIIALFIFIFITGIIVTVISINTTLNKKAPTELVKAKDTLNLLKQVIRQLIDLISVLLVKYISFHISSYKI